MLHTFCKKNMVDYLTLLTLMFISCNQGMNVKSQVEKYEPDYLIYHNYTQAFADVMSLAQKYPDYIQTLDKYKSGSGLSQLVIRITNFSNPFLENNVKILMAYGEHAREFFPIESMFYFLNNLTQGLEKTINCLNESFSKWVLNRFDIYIIALTNPDGKDYIEKSKNYCWRGNAKGIDINRNFDWNFGDIGSSKDPNDGEYRGPSAFSEPETEVFRELSRQVNFDGFFSFHSGIRHIYIPFADSKSKRNHRVPHNKNRIMELSRQMARASPLRLFQFGLAHKLNGYNADGTSFDYMAGVAKVPFSLAIEMWGHDNHVGNSCFDEFNPESEKLEEELVLVHPLYVEFLTYLDRWKKDILNLENTSDAKLRRSIVDLEQGEQPFEDLTESPSKKTGALHEDLLMYMLLLLLLAVVIVIIGLKYICGNSRKKRVISLKSLSSTFLLLRSL